MPVSGWTPTLITVQVPAGAAPGGASVVVTVGGEPSNTWTSFTIAGPPAITGLSLPQGPPQMGFAITGTGIGSPSSPA